jgi:hypothetical protein
MTVSTLYKVIGLTAIITSLSSCAWYRSELGVRFDPHSSKTKIESTTFYLGWKGGFEIDRAGLIYVGERFKDGEGTLEMHITNGKERLSKVLIEEAMIRSNRGKSKWQVLGRNLVFEPSEKVEVPMRIYVRNAPYELSVVGAFVDRSGKSHRFRLQDEVSMTRTRELNSMWDAMAF